MVSSEETETPKHNTGGITRSRRLNDELRGGGDTEALEQQITIDNWTAGGSRRFIVYARRVRQAPAYVPHPRNVFEFAAALRRQPDSGK